MAGVIQDTGRELRRIVRTNEEIKSVVATAFKINLMAMNAIFLAKRAGQTALGFGVLSNELTPLRHGLAKADEPAARNDLRQRDDRHRAGQAGQAPSRASNARARNLPDRAAV